MCKTLTAARVLLSNNFKILKPHALKLINRSFFSLKGKTLLAMRVYTVSITMVEVDIEADHVVCLTNDILVNKGIWGIHIVHSQK